MMQEGNEDREYTILLPLNQGGIHVSTVDFGEGSVGDTESFGDYHLPNDSRWEDRGEKVG